MAEHVRQMENEYDAWRVVADRWRKVFGETIDSERFDSVVRAIRWWAEILCALRCSQTEETRFDALDQALRMYRLSEDDE